MFPVKEEDIFRGRFQELLPHLTPHLKYKDNESFHISSNQKIAMIALDHYDFDQIGREVFKVSQEYVCEAFQQNIHISMFFQK